MKDKKTETKEEKPQNQENKLELELKAKLEEYTNTLKRLQADFDNYIKRTEKERDEFKKYAGYKLLTKLLSLYDDFDRTINAVKNVENQELKDGINLVHKQFTKLLEEEGVKKIECVGNKFDPYKHEILDIAAGKEDDVIVEELQKGYFLHDKILRTAKVRISKLKEEKENVQC